MQVHTVDAPRRLFPNAGAQLSFLCQLSAVSLSLIDGCLFLEKLDERERVPLVGETRAPQPQRRWCEQPQRVASS